MVPSRPGSEIHIKGCAETWTVYTYFNSKASGGLFRWGFFRRLLLVSFVDCFTLWWEIHNTQLLLMYFPLFACATGNIPLENVEMSFDDEVKEFSRYPEDPSFPSLV